MRGAGSERATTVTPKQRVLSAVGHREPDRVPHDLKVVPEVAARLSEILGVCAYDQVEVSLGLDLRDVHGRFEGPLQLAPRRQTFPDGTWEDVWGVRYRTVPNLAGGVHEEAIFHPLADATTAAEVERYPWPKVEDCYTFDHIQDFCDSNADYALTAGFAHFYCPGADLRSYETWHIDLAEQSAVAQAMLEQMEAYWLDYTNRVHEAAGGKLDIYCLADDYGMQDRMLMSPATWRRMFKPILSRFVDLAHSRQLPAFIHSCGSIRPIIPDLIDIGFDILDPVQPLARDMDPYDLKQEYGRDLCFHGAVDIQELLPHGTVAQVRDAVRRLVEVMGRDGGYILAPAHEVQADVPAENVVAMFA